MIKNRAKKLKSEGQLRLSCFNESFTPHVNRGFVVDSLEQKCVHRFHLIAKPFGCFPCLAVKDTAVNSTICCERDGEDLQCRVVESHGLELSKKSKRRRTPVGRVGTSTRFFSRMAYRLFESLNGAELVKYRRIEASNLLVGELYRRALHPASSALSSALLAEMGLQRRSRVGVCRLRLHVYDPRGAGFFSTRSGEPARRVGPLWRKAKTGVAQTLASLANNGHVHVGSSRPNGSSANVSCLLHPCQETGFDGSIVPFTAEVPLYRRLLEACTLVDDPAEADAFLAPLWLGTLVSLAWTPMGRPLALMPWLRFGTDAFAAGRRLPPERTVLLFSVDSQHLMEKVTPPELVNATWVHLGDTNYN